MTSNYITPRCITCITFDTLNTLATSDILDKFHVLHTLHSWIVHSWHSWHTWHTWHLSTQHKMSKKFSSLDHLFQPLNLSLSGIQAIDVRNPRWQVAQGPSMAGWWPQIHSMWFPVLTTTVYRWCQETAQLPLVRTERSMALGLLHFGRLSTRHAAQSLFTLLGRSLRKKTWEDCQIAQQKSQTSRLYPLVN